jgi:hypothetical protein
MNPVDHDDDERLSALFRRAAVPTVPGDLEGQVRRRVRRRRRRTVVGAACVVAGLSGLMLWYWPKPSRPADGTPVQLAEVRELFAGPPVASLDILTRQQDAYLELLEQLQKE